MFVRPPHFLARNHATSTPNNHIFLSVVPQFEPIGKDHCARKQTLLCGHVKHTRLENGLPTREDSIPFKREDVLWAFIVRYLAACRTLWVWTHGMGQAFTLCGGWERLRKGVIKLSHPKTTRRNTEPEPDAKSKPRKGFVSAGEGCFIIDGWIDGSRAIFVDTTNWLPASLEALAEMFSIEPYNPGEIAEPSDIAAGKARHAVSVIERTALALIGLVTKHDLGNFAFTMAGQSMRAYRHRFMETPIHIHGHRQSLKLERDSYRGGRSEAFFWGATGERLTRLDVNGLFASVMRDMYFPCLIQSHFGQESVTRLTENLAIGGAIARVSLESDSSQYPIYRTDRLYYATGKFTATLAGPELKLALANGHVTGVGEVAYYKMAAIFRKFVDYCWDQRQAALTGPNPVAYQWWKAIVNALYGRWGQRGLSWQCSKACPPPGSDCQWFQAGPGDTKLNLMRHLGDICEMRVSGPEGMESFPAIASYITSYARVAMDRFRAICGERNVYLQYIDTLIVNNEGLARLQIRPDTIGQGLGQLRVIDHSDGATFWGPCDWLWNRQPKVCGVPASASSDGNGVFEFYRHESGDRAKSHPSDKSITSSRVRVEMARVQPAGRVDSDGWVSPYRVE